MERGQKIRDFVSIVPRQRHFHDGTVRVRNEDESFANVNRDSSYDCRVGTIVQKHRFVSYVGALFYDPVFCSKNQNWLLGVFGCSKFELVTNWTSFGGITQRL